MDRNQRSRNQKKSVPPRKGQPSHRNTKSAPPQRSSRPAGSQQRPKGSGQRPAKQPERQPPKQQQKRPRPQQNPQKPGYRSSAPQVQRRVTRAEQLRIRRRKAIIGVLCVLAVLVIGIVLSINLLFKVTDFRVENADRTTPANTGIYTEQQLIDATGIQVGDNLYGFSTKEKSDQLLAQMPYLDVAVVTRQAPGTVIIRVQPAVERFKMEYSGSWLVLSEQLKVLRVEPAEPDNLVQLDALLPEGAATTPGSFLTLDAPSEPTALATAMPSGTATPENADEADTPQETPQRGAERTAGRTGPVWPAGWHHGADHAEHDRAELFCIRAVCRFSWARQTIWITRSGLPPISFWILVAMAWQAVTAVRWMFRTSRRTAPFSRAFCRRKTLWPLRSRPRNPRQRIPRMLPPMQRQMVQT